MALITIGVTCYNAQDTIERAIQSALNQTWQNIEIIVVDDESTDASVQKITAYPAKHDQVHLIRHDRNKGPAAARNTIIDHANGEFIAFFDDDDESLPERLQMQYDRIINYETETGADLIVCYASGTRRYANGYELDLNAIGAKAPLPYGEGMADQILFFGGPKHWNYGGTPTCSLMARTKAFKDTGKFDETLRRIEDLDFAVRIALKGGHFIGCSEKLFIQHATDSSDKSRELEYKAAELLVEKNKAYLEAKKRYYYAKNWPKLRYHYFGREYIKVLGVLLGLWLRYPLQVTKHFLKTGPARLLHDKKIKS